MSHIFRNFKSIFFCLILTGYGLSFAQTNPPQRVNFQGRLTDLSDNPLNGAYSLTFSLYNAPTGGASLWTETQAGVSIVNGAVESLLGSVTPIPYSVSASSSVYLEIQVGAELLSPRQPFSSVLYAMNTYQLAGKTYDTFVDTSTAQTISGIKTFSANPVFNAGAIGQDKVSGLTASLATVASATTTLKAQLDGISGDNLGNHTATTSLNMANFSITNVNTIVATNSITAGNFIGNGSGLTGVSGDNLGNHTATANLNMAGRAIVSAGTVTAVNFVGSGAALTGISGDNLGSHTAAQGLNMAGFGILNVSSVSVTNFITAAGINVGTVTASIFSGNGSGLTGVIAANVPAAGVQAGSLSPSVVASSVSVNSVSDQSIVSVSASKLTGALPAISGAALTGIAGDNLGNHTATSALDMGYFPINNISSITAFSFSGNGSGLTGVPGDDLGNHTASANLNMANNAIINVSTLIVAGPGTFQTASGEITLGVITGASANTADIRLVSGNKAWAIGHGGDAFGHLLGIQHWNGSTWDSGALNILATGQVGIGDASPAEKLSVSGNIKATGGLAIGVGNGPVTLSIGAGAGDSYIIAPDDQALTIKASRDAGLGTAFQVHTLNTDRNTYLERFGINGGSDTAKVYMLASNVGIGTNAPTSTLTVVGTFKLADGTQSAGRVLTSDSAGLASWQAAPGDNLGNHIATASLNMSGFNIINVGTVAAGNFVGNGSGLTGISGDNLGNHTAGTSLNMADNAVDNVSTLTAAGYIAAGHYRIGNSPVLAILAGGDSLGVGGDTGNINTGAANTFVGANAGNLNTLGEYNTFLGARAGANNTEGSGNAFLGRYAGYMNTTGGDNSFVGNEAGGNNDAGLGNTFVGAMSGHGNINGTKNVFVGSMAGLFTRGSANAVFGSEAGGFNDYSDSGSFSSSTVVGYRAGYYLSEGSADNIFVGFMAGANVTTGSRNIIIGYEQNAPLAATSNHLNIGGAIYGDLGSGNIGIGTNSPGAKLEVSGDVKITGGTPGAGKVLTSDSSGLASWQTVSGDNLGDHTAAQGLNMAWNSISNISSMTAGGAITAGTYQINGSTVLAILQGAGSLGVGVDSGRINSGAGNTFVGNQAGYANTAGTGNTFMGVDAGRANTTANGGTFVGIEAGYANTTGAPNTFVGDQAGRSNTTGNWNVFMGYQTGYNNTTGTSNSFVGMYAGITNTTGAGNSLFGYQVGQQNQTGSANAIFGGYAGGPGSGGPNSFSSSTIMGYKAGYGLSTGSDNILLGFQAGQSLTTGSGNIVIGYNQEASTMTPASASNTLNIGGAIFGNLTNGYIGIGYPTPAAKLDVAGNVRVVDGTQGAGKVLTSDANGFASWQMADSADNLGSHIATMTLNMASFPIANVSSITMGAIGLRISTSTSVGAVGIVISTTGGIYTVGYGGNGSNYAPAARGLGSVDLQSFRVLGADRVAAGIYSTIAGGIDNKIIAGTINSFIGAGDRNTFTASVQNSVIGGGYNNAMGGSHSFIGGGYENTANHAYISIPGGMSNSAGSQYTSITGGFTNAIDTFSDKSVILGGSNNSISNGFYALAAGFYARSNAYGAFTWADSQGQPVDNNVADRTVFKNRGGFLITGSTNTMISGTANRGVFITGDGLVGISTDTPRAALDVVSSGGYAQIWRDSSGLVVASMTANGIFSTSIPASGDNLGDHMATQNLNMGGYSISNINSFAVSTLTASGSSGLAALGVIVSTNIIMNSSGTGADNYIAVPFIAGGDISAKQAVILGGGNTVSTTTTLGSTLAIGFAVTNATAGQTVWVAVQGTVTGVVADGIIALGALVKTATTVGRVVTSGGMGNCNIGIALTPAGGAGASINVLMVHN